MNLGRSIRRRRGDGGRHEDEGEQETPWAPKPRSGSARAFSSGWLLAAGVVLGGFLVGYLYATQVVFPSAEAAESIFVAVPDLRGMGQSEAETMLAERGLILGSVDSIGHPDVGIGGVLGQAPLPGQLLEPSATVELTVSAGPERRPIPDIERLRLDQAVTVLAATGFEVRVDSIEADVPEGRVVSTFPDAGVVLPVPGIVTVTVSLGPPMVTMPALAGIQEEEARTVLDSLGLVVGDIETRFRFGFNQGEVLEHFPPADSIIPAGTRVRLVVGNRGFF